jgi:hypothetical protein
MVIGDEYGTVPDGMTAAVHAWWCGTCAVGSDPFSAEAGAVAGMDGHVATKHEGVAPRDATILRILLDAGGLAELAVAGNRPALRTGLAGLHPDNPDRAAAVIAAVRDLVDGMPAQALPADGWTRARRVLAECCPHPVVDVLGFCTGCSADTTAAESPVGEWVLVFNPAPGDWELYADGRLVAGTDLIEPDSQVEAWGWAATAVAATGTTVLTFDERPSQRYGDVEYVAVLAAPGQEV